MDQVREGFERGDEKIVMENDIQKVIWVKGKGEKILGYNRVEDMIEGKIDMKVEKRRKIEELRREKKREKREVEVRMGGGLR